MLTPAGAGGRRRSGPRRGRRVLVVVLVLVLLGTAAAAGWWWIQVRDDGAAEASPAPTVLCTTPPPKQPRDIPPTAEVRVNVLNATDTQGLAIETANQLVLRGFDVAGVGNAPKVMAAGVAKVLYGKPGFGDAVRVASYVPGAELVKTERIPDASVDLRLGPDFNGIVSDKQARRGLDDVVLPVPEPRCS